MLKNLIVLIGIISSLFALNAQANIVTYSFNGNFANSHWNADSSNANRVPGGPLSGTFSIDTSDNSLSQVNVDTSFFSLYGPKVLDSFYDYAVSGETDDAIGPQTINLSGVPSSPLYVGLALDLQGTTTSTVDSTSRTGSIIQIMDTVITASRIYKPVLTLFVENVDLTQTPQTLSLWATESVYNINRGTGIAGYSGSQGWIQLTANSNQASSSGSVPSPTTLLLLLGLLPFIRNVVAKKS